MRAELQLQQRSQVFQPRQELLPTILQGEWHASPRRCQGKWQTGPDSAEEHTEQAGMQNTEMLGEGILKNQSPKGKKCAHNTPLILTICSVHLGVLLIWWP